MPHIVEKENVGLCLMSSLVNTELLPTVLISNNLINVNFFGFQAYLSTVYLYTVDEPKVPNMNKEIISKIRDSVGKITPEEIFDYIYAALHSQNYRKEYNEFLKIDFPCVPYPKDRKSFNKLKELGTELR